MTKIAIIGAGLCGVTVATLLQNHAEIRIFEKARGVSGRMSTRRAEPYFFDHGAQYFTARTLPFQQFIQPLIELGLIQRWNARYVKLDGNQIIERKDWREDEPRYVGVPGMNVIVKHLAKNLEVTLHTRIANVRKEAQWQLYDDQGILLGAFDWVISTAPAPQTVQIFPEEFAYYSQIKAIEMRACFSLMLGFSAPLPLEFEAAHITHPDLSWLAVNSHKPDRGESYTLMVHSSEEFAEAHIEADRNEVMQYLCSATSRLIGYDVSLADYKTVHAWRYANNAKREQGPTFLDVHQQLGACGDWCFGGRVEGAFGAAYQLSEQMKEKIG